MKPKLKECDYCFKGFIELTDVNLKEHSKSSNLGWNWTIKTYKICPDCKKYLRGKWRYV